MVFFCETRGKIYRYIEISTFGLINYIIIVSRADCLMESYQIVDRTEKKMKELKMTIDYEVCRQTVLLLNFLFILMFFIVAFLYWISVEKFETFVWEIFLTIIPICLMTTSVYNSQCLGALLRTRFEEITKIIEDQLCI